MNKHTQTDKDEDDDKISSLYKQGSTETPSSNINDTILFESRHHSYQPIKSLIISILNAITFSKPLTFAAVLVISISIILQIQFQQPDEIEAFDSLKPNGYSHMSGQEASIPSTPEISDSYHSKRPANKIIKKERSSNVLTQPDKMTARKQKVMLRSIVSQKKNSPSKSIRSMAASPSLHTTITEKPTTPNCDGLTDFACLSSKDCILNFINDEMSCQLASQRCEQNFIQYTNQPDLCQQKENCHFIQADCRCNNKDACQCKDNIVPGCHAITEQQ